ncbi:MAG: response regulator transcription factor [Candidatus Aquicultor sp.]|nr:response regulator transcription factor [Candidatus Aquicultor sp.]
MGNVRILLAEDHVLLRESLRQYLERAPDLEVVGEAGDGEEMLSMVSQYKPDIIIMDVAMPKLDGIEAMKRIKAIDKLVPILVLSAYDIDQYVFPLLEAGAAGYLLKDISGNELIESIHRVIKGDAVIHPTIMRKVLQRFRNVGSNQQDISLDLLTDRETEVFNLAVSGMSNKEIAGKLGVSIRTVEAHFGHIFNKLEVSSRTEVIILAFKKGWVK